MKRTTILLLVLAAAIAAFSGVQDCTTTFAGKAFVTVADRNSEYEAIRVDNSTGRVNSLDDARAAAMECFSKTRALALKTAELTWRLSEEDLIITGHPSIIVTRTKGRTGQNGYCKGTVEVAFEIEFSVDNGNHETLSMVFEYQAGDAEMEAFIQEIKSGKYDKLKDDLADMIGISADKITIYSVKEVDPSTVPY
ncbi:MAG: hypothetical protein PHW04_18955 [Candidatus Wallbacteria bacterium]|nr:hypothetical protein [Candidatus Wallbacteria bacterium]